MMCKKQFIFGSLLLIALVFLFGDTLAFEFNIKPYHVGSNQRFNMKESNSTNFCCLPDVFSIKAAQTQVIFKTSSMETSDVKAQMWADYKTGKVRTSGEVTINGKLTTVNTWKFKLTPQLTINYEETGSSCFCNKAVVDEWKPVCVPKTESTKISKASVGEYSGYLLEDNTPDLSNQNWVFHEKHRSDVCWILSSTLTVASNFLETQYYDMEWLINQDVFKVSPNCPALEQCLKK